MSDLKRDQTNRKRRLSPRRIAAFRLNEIKRLEHARVKCRTCITVDNWLFVICDALAPLEEAEGGLDIEHVREFLGDIDDAITDMAVSTIHIVCDYRAAHPDYGILSAESAGKKLDLTAEERWLCKIRTMESCEESRSQRRDRQAVEKRGPRS